MARVMARRVRGGGWIAALGAAAGLWAPMATAQQCGTPSPTTCAVEGERNGPEPAAVVVDGRSLQEMQRDLRRLRATYFGTMRNREIRQIGITRLREYTDPVIFPELLEIFAREQEDVRTAVLDHLFDLKTDQADATLAWAAMHDKQEWFRKAALERLVTRTDEVGHVPMRVQWAVATGLKKSGSELDAAAELAADLRLFEAIPMMINAQIIGSSRGAGSRGGSGAESGALAYILIGQQRAFVADLTPVVGNNAVAFDPQLAVVTSGTYIRVTDASVITYRASVNAALTRLADAGWDGRSTRSFGFDQQRWADWYVNEFVPHRKRVDAMTAAGPK